MNAGDCQWIEAAPPRLDRQGDTRHLIRDARIAEELAIRHADVTRGHRSGHYAGAAAYTGARETCLATLSNGIASLHGVTTAQVTAAIGQRDVRLDAAVLLTFTLIFAIAVNRFAWWLFERFPPDEPRPAIVAGVAAAVVVSAAGVILGGLGASLVEMFHVGNTHLSYRAYRLPWNQHWPPLFTGAVVIFSLIATIRWRQRQTSV